MIILFYPVLAKAIKKGRRAEELPLLLLFGDQVVEPNDDADDVVLLLDVSSPVAGSAVASSCSDSSSSPVTLPNRFPLKNTLFQYFILYNHSIIYVCETRYLIVAYTFGFYCKGIKSYGVIVLFL